jgi:Dolichyl-phosphate-mannose-protein mannosyltransferase
MLEKIRSLFRYDGKLDLGLIILFCVINLIVLTNSILHHPKIGYDSSSNLSYIVILSNRLPASADTFEFFNPPLPFLIPSLFNDICNLVVPGPTTNFKGLDVKWDCRTYDGKFAQFLNLLLSIGISLVLLLISDQIKPGNRYFKLSILVLLSILTVYYKTFSQVRGEPYLLFFVVLSTYFVINILTDASFNLRHVLLLGFSLGLMMLTRQWGAFVYPAIVLLLMWIFLHDRQLAVRYVKPILISFLISAVVGGWFYLHLYLSEGSITAFNIKSPGFSLSNLPPDFFRGTGLKNFELFTHPVRPLFNNLFFPTLYSDVWGDYWGYFTFYKQNSGFQDSSGKTVALLGQVNAFAIIPTILLVLGACLGVAQLFRRNAPMTPEKLSMALINLIAMTSLAGFMWFIISYYPTSQATLKATYIIQLFIVLLFPAAELLEKMRTWKPVAYWLTLSLLLIVLIHNLPAMITNYRMF